MRKDIIEFIIFKYVFNKQKFIKEINHGYVYDYIEQILVTPNNLDQNIIDYISNCIEIKKLFIGNININKIPDTVTEVILLYSLRKTIKDNIPGYINIVKELDDDPDYE